MWDPDAGAPYSDRACGLVRGILLRDHQPTPARTAASARVGVGVGGRGQASSEPLALKASMEIYI